MNWGRLAFAAVVPIFIALPVAALFWRRKRIDIGNAMGGAVFFVSAIVFAGGEYVEGIAYRMQCEAMELGCPKSEPSDFVKLMGYGFLAFIQVCALYLGSMRAERRIRENDYSPEWRNGLGL